MQRKGDKSVALCRQECLRHVGADDKRCGSGPEEAVSGEVIPWGGFEDGGMGKTLGGNRGVAGALGRAFKLGDATLLVAMAITASWLLR